ncbi:MAG: alpha-L-fucosidase [Myxococcota bacterium]
MAPRNGWFGLLLVVLALSACRRNEAADGRTWWERPGLGIMYMTEWREGWGWARNFDDFNASISDDEGNLDFQGPFPQTDDWVALSRDLKIDYHLIWAKWHDGICYWDTEQTDWKTEVDYMAPFAKKSRRARIPFMFYYSTIFDHNPQFDDIQPSPNTWSVILSTEQPIYEDYLRAQFAELVETYEPDGLWLDWYSADRSTSVSIEWFEDNAPDTLLTFNQSSYQASESADLLSFTSGESHYVRRPEAGVEDLVGVLYGGAWEQANRNRAEFDHPWELVGPLGEFWQTPEIRSDRDELVRIVAITLASGGRYAMGAIAQADGSIRPDHVEQARWVADWYEPRRDLFQPARALPYPGDRPPGVDVPKGYQAIASQLGADTLLHVINMDGQSGPVLLTLDADRWGTGEGLYLEPQHTSVTAEQMDGQLRLTLDPAERVDTIVRVEGLTLDPATFEAPDGNDGWIPDPKSVTTCIDGTGPYGPICPEIASCTCSACAQELEECETDAACVAIVRCALETNCRGALCYAADTCQAVIDEHGGLTSPSLIQAAAVSTCSDEACGICDEP